MIRSGVFSMYLQGQGDGIHYRSGGDEIQLGVELGMIGAMATEALLRRLDGVLRFHEATFS